MRVRLHEDWHGLGSTWDFLWHFLIIFAWIAYLLVLFQILGDLFRRDHKTSGWVKAIWVAFLILFPCITALIYLIARGKGMAARRRRPPVQRRRPTTTSGRPQAVRRCRKSPMPRRFWKPGRSLRPSSNRRRPNRSASGPERSVRFDQADGALRDNRKQARAKPFAAQLNAGSTPRSATDIAAREH